MPYDSSSSNSVTLSISGFLGLSFDDSTTLTLSGASNTFSRAMSYSAVVYFLVAQTDYSFGLGGTSSEILPSGASVMPVAEPYSFDTREFYFFLKQNWATCETYPDIPLQQRNRGNLGADLGFLERMGGGFSKIL